MRPVLSFSSASHQSFWATLRVWLGGTQVDAVNTVWAEALAAAATAMVVRANLIFMGVSPGWGG